MTLSRYQPRANLLVRNAHCHRGPFHRRAHRVDRSVWRRRSPCTRCTTDAALRHEDACLPGARADQELDCRTGRCCVWNAAIATRLTAPSPASSHKARTRIPDRCARPCSLATNAAMVRRFEAGFAGQALGLREQHLADAAAAKARIHHQIRDDGVFAHAPPPYRRRRSGPRSPWRRALRHPLPPGSPGRRAWRAAAAAPRDKRARRMVSQPVAGQVGLHDVELLDQGHDRVLIRRKAVRRVIAIVELQTKRPVRTGLFNQS